MDEKPNLKTILPSFQDGVELYGQVLPPPAEAARSSAPGSNQPVYHLRDLIDVEQFQTLQDRLFELYSCPSVIVDNDGTELTNTAWQDACRLFHRKNKAAAADCIESDDDIQTRLVGETQPMIYRCRHGLMETAIPIWIDGIHYGNLHTGQYFVGKPDLEFYREQARRFGFDEKAYLKAIKKVPVWSAKKRESYLNFMKGLIEVIANSGLKRLREIETRKKIDEHEEGDGAILRQMSDGFWVISPAGGKIIDANQALCQMVGFTRDELLLMSFADVEAYAAPEIIQERLSRVIREGTIHFETGFRRKDGGLCDVEASLTYISSQDLLFGFHRDITERKQVEKVLRERDQQFQAITEASPDALLVTRFQDGLILYANEQSGRMVGIPSANLINRVTPDFYADPADRGTFLANLKAGRIVSNWEMKLKRADGTPFWALVSARLELFEGVMAIYAGIRDISERKQAEESLRLSEQAARGKSEQLRMVNQIGAAIATGLDLVPLLRTLYEECRQIGDTDTFYVALYDDETGMLSFPIFNKDDQPVIIPSQSLQEYAGITGYLVQHPQVLYIPDLDVLPEGFPVIRFSGSHTHSYLGVPLYVGERVIGILSIQSKAPNAYTPEQIQTLEMLGTQVAIAIQNSQLYEQVRKALVEKETLLRELYHRTRNNMGVINSLLGLQAGYFDDEHLRGVLASTQNRIHSMALVHQKLYETSDLSHINLKEYIHDLALLLMQSYSIRQNQISFAAELEDVYVMIDTAIPCGLILNELISNALKYAFPNGRSGQVRVGLHRIGDDQVELTVADDGVGMPPGKDPRRDGSMGLQTLFNLAEYQLNAQVSYTTGPGVSYRILFSNNQYGKRV